MKTLETLKAIETREERFQIRNGLRADVDALKKVYRETREDGPAATVAAFIAAVGYNRAAVVVSTLVNRHAWDGRISRRAASWAAEQPEAWDEQTAVEIGLYIDDVIHLAHFDQIAREFMKTTPPEDPDKRPETISEDAAPETPETISAGTEAAEDNTIILVETTYDIRNGGSSTRRVLYTPGKGLETIPEPEAPEAVAAPDPVPEAEAAPAALEAAPESPETISAGTDAPQAAPEARPRRQAPEKPARGPGKPLDCIGQIITGNGWQIVFDGNLQRTRVVIEEAAREKAAPLAEAAGFYYSVNTDSWHKKLSHKARRAAEALAEQLRAACA